MKFKLNIDPQKEEEIIITVHAPSALTEQIENLVLKHQGTDTLIGYCDDELTRLPYESIECITVIDRKVFAINTQGSRFRLKSRLCELEELLPSYFIRINKSTLANERRIVRFKATLGGAVDAVFRCGYVDYVSRRCFTDIKRRFEP